MHEERRLRASEQIRTVQTSIGLAKLPVNVPLRMLQPAQELKKQRKIHLQQAQMVAELRQWASLQPITDKPVEAVVQYSFVLYNCASSLTTPTNGKSLQRGEVMTGVG